MAASGSTAADGQGRALPAHLPALDGVRGIAILWVMLHNLWLFEGKPEGLTARVFDLAADAGWAGVTLFFVLSGFLITGILLDTREEPHSLRNFYVRRVLRIFPLYYAVLFVAFVLLPLFGTVPEHVAADRPHQWWLWAYLSNWVEPAGVANKTFPHFWSLAVEEQFYLLWPFLLKPRDAKGVVRLALAVAVAALVIRIGMWAAGASAEALYTFSVCRMDALALGAAAAAALRVPAWRAWVLVRGGQLMAASGVVFVVTVLGCDHLARLDVPMQTAGYSLLAISFSLLLLALAGADATGEMRGWASVWRIAPLGVLARYSYGMYVFHKILSDAIGKPWLKAQGAAVQGSVLAHLAYAGAAMLATLCAAMLSYHLFERRFLELKPRFAPQPALPRAAST